MQAVEQFSFSTSDEYRSIFQRYITRSIDALATRLGAELTELSNESIEQAWHLLDYGLKLTHGWEGVRRLLLTLAPRMEREGFRREWLPYLERGVTFSRSVHDAGGEAQLSFHIGRLHRLLGETAAARQWFESSAALFAQVADKAGRAQALNQLAYALCLQRQMEPAQAYAEEALALLEAGDGELATSHWVLGIIARYQRKWEEAETHHRISLQIRQAQGDRQGMAWLMQNLGETLRQTGRFEQAVEYFEEAIRLLGEIHDPVNQAIARMSLGVARYERKDYEQARALFALAERVFRRVKDQWHLAMIYTNSSLVERATGNPQLAEELVLKAIDLWEMFGEMNYLATCCDDLGVLYQEMGRLDEAIAGFERGLATLDQIAATPFGESVRSSLTLHLDEAKKRRFT
jgi:tetratricopeptide (TPR) repeat protein